MMAANTSTGLSCIPNPLILKFVHHGIDNICGGVPLSHRDYNECPEDKFVLAIQNLKDLITAVGLEKISNEQVVSYLHPVPKETAEEIYDALVARKAEIRKSLVRSSVSNTLHLEDMSWTVKIAVASDKVLDLNETLTTLELHTSLDGTEKQSKSICVDMSVLQVDALLEKLKEAQRTLTLLKSN